MEGVGTLVIIVAAWLGYCGLNSIRPIRMLMAIASNPSGAVTILDEAHKAVAATTAAASASNNNVGGLGEPSGTVTPDIPGQVSSSVSSEQAYANQAGQQIFGRIWNNAQQAALIQLWNRESGWNPAAYNASSGATGIPQSLPGSKMASAGSDWKTNPKTQINWGLNYIKSRYGSPVQAEQHETQYGWY